ncbi:MAG TPA: hypothetical protein VFT72_06155 [Opitutaceae bacterium]|nr:hypothetical protein [Opitutaceae bacterium]
MSYKAVISILIATIFQFAAGAALARAANQNTWISTEDVRAVGEAIFVTSFPMRQADLSKAIGYQKTRFMVGRSDSKGRYVGMFAITDPETEWGFYGLEITYCPTEAVQANERMVDGVVLIFWSKHAGRFAQQIDPKLFSSYEEIRKDLQRRNVSPFQWAMNHLADESTARDQEALK